MRSRWFEPGVGIALVAAAALVGIVVNFGLLRLTQDSADPVGKLRPRVALVPHVGTTSESDTVAPDDEADGGQDRDD